MTDEQDDLGQLLELQSIDSRIRRLQHQLDDLEEQKRLDEAETELSEIKETLATLRVELDRAEAQQRKLDGEIDLLKQRRDDEHARMYSGDIHNPKELQSLRAEIESTERRISEYEDELLESMEKGEAIAGEITRLEDEQLELEERIEILAAERDEAAQGLLAEKAELEVERDGHREALPDDLLERYDAAVADHGGIGVAELDGGMCTGCRIELPMADRQRLLEGPPLGRCPQCNRLLVVP